MSFAPLYSRPVCARVTVRPNLVRVYSRTLAQAAATRCRRFWQHRNRWAICRVRLYGRAPLRRSASAQRTGCARACADDRLSVRTFAARPSRRTRREQRPNSRPCFRIFPEGAARAVRPRRHQLDFVVDESVVDALQEPRIRRLSLPRGGDILLGRSRACDCVISDPTFHEHMRVGDAQMGNGGCRTSDPRTARTSTGGECPAKSTCNQGIRSASATPGSSSTAHGTRPRRVAS